MKTATALPTPWVRRYGELGGRLASVEDRVTVRAVPLGPVATLSRTEIGELFARAAKKIYLPSEEDSATLSAVAQIAASFARDRFSSVERFRELRCMPASWRPEPGPIYCLTGPAGSGRTSLLAQLPKVMPIPGDIALTINEGSAVESLQLREYAQVTIQARLKNGPVDDLVDLFSAGRFGRLRGVAADQFLRKAMLNSGASILTADEFQFLTQSDGAIALIVQMLFRLSSLGIPVLFAANYSLCSRLFLRPKQDRDRILANPMIIGESKPDVEYIKRYVAELISLSPASFALPLNETGELLSLRTLGNRRAIVALVKVALETAHGNRKTVDIDCLNAAYYSSQFTSQREDVENCIKLSLGATPERDCKDLVCPFSLPATDMNDLRRIAAAEREVRVDEALRRARMSVKELAEHDRLSGVPRNTRPKSTSRPRGARATAVTLLANAGKFREGHFKKPAK